MEYKTQVYDKQMTLGDHKSSLLATVAIQRGTFNDKYKRCRQVGTSHLLFNPLPNDKILD